MSKKLFTAIVFMAGTVPPRKYRNINNIASFVKFCESFDGQYINLYEKTTKNFVERIYIKKGV
jgi:hypothetical protein